MGLAKNTIVLKVSNFVQKLVSKFRRNFFQEKSFTNLGENSSFGENEEYNGTNTTVNILHRARSTC